jgi:hypothetical protein
LSRFLAINNINAGTAFGYRKKQGNSKQRYQFDAGGKLLSPENLLPGMEGG